MTTKSEFQEWLRDLITPLEPFYSKSGALLEIGRTGAHYPDRVAHMEGFARVLWGLSPRWKGGGDIPGYAALYRRGLAAGTNPNHADYWDAEGEVNQRYVEMAAIALGLLLTPEILWEPLSGAEKANLARWLLKINTIDINIYPDCNWWFFVIITNLALKSLGKEHNPKLVEHAFARIESFYIDGGWYQDGTANRCDYYVPFAIHFYSLIYSVFAKESDPARCKLFRERAETFAADFLYWFDDNGRAVPYGRSLTYRFAQAAFWSAYAFAGLQKIPVGVVKGIISRHLRDWANSDMLDRDGILTIGYRYPCLNMAETYNAPGSPYWAFKTCLFLAFPDEHAFWSAPVMPMPELDRRKAFVPAKMLIQRGCGHTVMYPSAVFRCDDFGHMPEKYGKFAYSTEFAFSVAVGNHNLGLAAPDSMLAFRYDGQIFTRRAAVSSELEGLAIRSVWSPLAGIEVETLIIPTERGHIRRHNVTNRLADCKAFDCGFAVQAPAPNAYTAETHGDAATAACKNAWCAITSKSGGAPFILTAAPNTNLNYTKTVIPCIKYEIPLGKTVLETEITAKVNIDEQ